MNSKVDPRAFDAPLAEADEFASLLNKSANLVVEDTSEFCGLLDTAKFYQIQRAAKMYAGSNFVPEVFQGNVANCAVALQMALRLGVDPVTLMQKMYIIHGRPAVEAQLKIALANSRGPFESVIDWRVGGEGKDRFWTAFATLKDSKRVVEFTVDWAMVEAEGWDKPRGKGDWKQPSKWTTLADKMGRYRSASYLIDLYCPGLLMGLMTSDEAEEIETEIDIERVDPVEKPKIKTPRARPKEQVDTNTGEITNPLPPDDVSKPNPPPPPPPAASVAAPTQTPEVPSLLDARPTAADVKREPPKPASPQPADAPLATPGMRKILRVKLANANIDEADFEIGFGKTVDELLSTDINAAIAFATKSTAS